MSVSGAVVLFDDYIDFIN